MRSASWSPEAKSSGDAFVEEPINFFCSDWMVTRDGWEAKEGPGGWIGSGIDVLRLFFQAIPNQLVDHLGYS